MEKTNLQFFEVTAGFKTEAAKILAGRPFSEVANPMAILKKETYVYRIDEINQVIGYLGDLPYATVSAFFDKVQEMVKEVKAPESADEPVAQPEPVAEN